MQVRVVVIGDCYGQLGIFKAPGQKMWIDEKQAQLGVDAGVFEIIERPEPIAIPASKKKMNVR